MGSKGAIATVSEVLSMELQFPVICMEPGNSFPVEFDLIVMSQ